MAHCHNWAKNPLNCQILSIKLGVNRSTVNFKWHIARSTDPCALCIEEGSVYLSKSTGQGAEYLESLAFTELELYLWEQNNVSMTILVTIFQVLPPTSAARRSHALSNYHRKDCSRPYIFPSFSFAICEHRRIWICLNENNFYSLEREKH